MLASQKMNDIGEVKSWLKAYDRVHNWMKAQMVATPGFVMRNIMGGMANMWFADIPIDETFRTIRLITQAMNQGDGNLEAGLRKLVANNPEDIEFRNALQLVQLNAHGGGQATSSVDIKMGKSSWFDYVVGTKKSVGQGGVPANYRSANIRVNPLDAGFFLFSGVRNANSIAESAMRLGTGLHSMRVGRNLDDAVDEIFRLHFDYSKLSGAESNIAKRFVPFYTWTRNNLPLQISFLAQGGVVAGIMSSPNQGWEKIASSKMGERFSRVFTDPESMVVNRLTRSTDPNDVILGNTLRKGYNRGSGKQNFIQDEGFKDRKAFIKAVKLDPDLPRNIGMNTLEKTTALSPELGDTIMDAVRRGVDPAEAIDLVAGPGFADNVLAQFDNKMSLEQIGKIILGHHDQYVAANDISRLISPSLYGNSAGCL